MKKILLIKRGSFSYTNESVIKLLEREFPDHPVEVIDIQDDLFSANPALVWVNWFAVFLYYFPQLLMRVHDPRACFLRTPYIARAVHRKLPSLLRSPPVEYLFSLQTSSIYDASVEGIPNFVYTDHTHKTNLYYPTFDHRKFFSRAWVAEEALIYKNARKIFTLGGHVEKSLVEHYGIPPAKVRCVFAGSNAEYAVGKELAAPKLLENDGYTNKRVVFIGVDWERKGGPELVEAFRKVIEKVPDARLDVVGCSPQVDCPGVNVIGRVPIGEVRDWFAKASVFCLPTKVEPFGIVFVEALAHKLPVIASDIGAIPQIVEHGKSGFLCDPTDTDAIAGHLLTLLGDPAMCKSFGEAGCQRVEEVMNWDAVGKAMASSIREELGIG